MPRCGLWGNACCLLPAAVVAGQVAVATGSKRHPELPLGTVPQRPLNGGDSGVGRGDAPLGL